MNENEKQLLNEYLSSQKLMSLATSDGKGNMWSANVFFCHDKDFNIYFMSAPDSLHCQFISVNKRVSLTICDSHQDEVTGKVGLQLSGICEHVAGEVEVKAFLPIWNAKFAKKPAPPLEVFKSNSPLYMITPKRIKFFNEYAFKKKMREWGL